MHLVGSFILGAKGVRFRNQNKIPLISCYTPSHGLQLNTYELRLSSLVYYENINIGSRVYETISYFQTTKIRYARTQRLEI